jgi:hypothetical protein
MRIYVIMSSENQDDQTRSPKNRGEVYTQEQQRIAEESTAGQTKERRSPKNRGEVYTQEQQRIAEETKK